MSVRPVLGLFLGMLLTMGCASASSEDSAADDSALRALQKGDLDVPVLGATLALNAPEKFSAIKSWTVDYVEMKDPVPDNNYKGLMIFGRDSGGETIYMMPVGYSGADALASQVGAPSMFIFDATPDADGNLTPVTFGIGSKASPERLASEKAALDWIVGEQARLLAEIAKAGDDQAQTGTASLRIQTFGWLTGAFCVAHLAAFFAGGPLTYFLIDGALDVAEGAVDGVATGMKDGSGAEIGRGVVKASVAGVGKMVMRTASTNVASKLAKGGKALGVVGAAGVIGYNVYKQGLAKGTLATLEAMIPDSCKKTFEAMISK